MWTLLGKQQTSVLCIRLSIRHPTQCWGLVRWDKVRCEFIWVYVCVMWLYFGVWVATNMHLCVCKCVWGKGGERMASRSRTAELRKPTQGNDSYIAPRHVWSIVVVWWDSMGSHLLPPFRAEGGFLDQLRWSWNEIPISSDAACSWHKFCRH